MATTIKKASPKPLPKPVQSIAKPAPKEYSHETGSGLDPDDNPEAGSDVAEAPVVAAVQAVGVVNKKFKDGSETDEQEKVGDVKAFTAPHATVGLSMAVTRNLGNYESVKMSVSLSVPCENNEEAIQAAFDEAKGWVDTRVELLNQEINDQLA